MEKKKKVVSSELESAVEVCKQLWKGGRRVFRDDGEKANMFRIWAVIQRRNRKGEGKVTLLS